MMHRIISLLIGSLLWCGAATTTAAEDLVTIYRQAQAEDRALRAASAALDAARERVPQIRSLLLPNAALGAGADATYSDVEGSNGTESAGLGLSLRVTQPLYDRAANLRQQQVASTVSSAEADFAAAGQALILRAANGYFDILSAQATLGFVLADKEAIARQLDQTTQRFEVGLIAITDVHEAQARYDNVLFEEIRARNVLDNAREALRVITGGRHSDLADLTADLPLVAPDPSDIDRWVAVAERDNLALLAARHGIESVRTEISVRRAGDDPTVDLVGSYAHSNDSRSRIDGGRHANSASVGVELSLPFYTGGRVAAEAREAEHDLRRVTELYELQRRDVERATRDAYRNVMASIRGVEALRQAVVSNQSAQDATQAGFEVGTRTVVDVLDAQRDLFRARRDYALARYSYVLSLLALKQAAGSLGEADVVALNRLLE